jgi:hypothetical protein
MRAKYEEKAKTLSIGTWTKKIERRSQFFQKKTFRNISFSSQLTNGPTKPECYITLGWNGLQGTNTLAYWVHSQVAKRNCSEYDSRGQYKFFVTYGQMN